MGVLKLGLWIFRWTLLSTIKIDIESNGVTHRYERELLDQVPDGVHLSKFIITDIDFDGQEDQYQNEVGDKYIYRSESIPFETEFTDDELIISWSNRTDSVWTWYYDNNNSIVQSTNGIPAEFAVIDLDDIDFTFEDSIMVRFSTQETHGAENRIPQP